MSICARGTGGAETATNASPERTREKVAWVKEAAGARFGLAYYFLWRYAGEQGWLPAALDDYIELELERVAKLKVDFEIGDALDKLEKLRIVEKVGDRYRAQPLGKALEMLDYLWDNYFQYNPGLSEPPVKA